MELDRYQKMKRQVEKLRSESERAAGRVEQLMVQLKEQFDCGTIKEAQAKLEKLEKDKEKAKKTFDAKFEAFNEEWGEKLEEMVG